MGNAKEMLYFFTYKTNMPPTFFFLMYEQIARGFRDQPSVVQTLYCPFIIPGEPRSWPRAHVAAVYTRTIADETALVLRSKYCRVLSGKNPGPLRTPGHLDDVCEAAAAAATYAEHAAERAPNTRGGDRPAQSA